jgi:putative ABC transport system permease protein
MIHHYLKFALRNFKANKVIFGGSLLTLCLGALCIALLYSYVPNELNMDGFHKRQKDIYMLSVKATPQSLPQIFDEGVFANINYKSYPELERAVTLKKYEEGELKISYNRSIFSPEGLIADSTFFQVFDFKLKLGVEATALNNPNAIILSEKLATTMFGEGDPIGKVIRVKSRKGKDFTVTGVLRNIPQNSSLEFDFVLPMQTSDPNLFSRMGGDFLLVKENFDKTAFEEKIKHMARRHFQFKESTLSLVPFDQQAIEKENLNSINLLSRKVDRKNLYLQIVIMGVILLVSALNFSNLQIISTNIRIKDSALKRINGAQKGHLFGQFIMEQALLIGIASTIVTTALKLILPTFNSFIGLYYTPTLWEIAGMVMVILCLLVVLGSIYPMISSYSFNIIHGLKNKGFTGNQMAGRKAVVVFQYALTFLLLISSITIARQLQLMLTKELGFKKDNIIIAKLFGSQDYASKEEQVREDGKIYQHLKNELASNTSIKNSAQGLSPLKTYLMDWRRKDGDFEYETLNMLTVTPNYEKVLGLELLEGRFFDKNLDQSRGVRIVINEAAKKYMNIKDISKSRILNKSWNTNEGYEIIGVVKDFNFEHLSTGIRPLMMVYFKDFEDAFLIEFEEGATQQGLAYITSLFKQNNPEESFDYSFLSDDVATMYQKEKQLGVNVALFSLIALIISAVGLFTIAIYDTQRRVKEIAIRKVNGAKASEILTMLNKNFMKWVLIALFLACPIGYYFMYRWLRGFAYKTELGWWTFAVAGTFTIAIAMLAVSWQSFKAATANPAKNLRTE